MRESCVTYSMCSSACAVALCERLRVWMDNLGLELVTSYTCKRRIHTGTWGAVSPLAKRVLASGAKQQPGLGAAGKMGCLFVGV